MNRRLSWASLAVCCALLGVAPSVRVSADQKRLEAEVKGIVPGLPFVGLAKSVNDGLRGGYYAEPAPGATEYPASDEKPPHVTFKAEWIVSAREKPLTTAELDKASEQEKGGLDKRAVVGTFGAHSWSLVTVEAGTNDPNMSGDPYIGYARGSVNAECGSVLVNASVGIYSHGSHGARNKPAVLEAVKRAAQGHLKNIIGQLTAVLRYGCKDFVEGPATPTETIAAETECATVTLVRGRLPSVPCGVYVRSWPANRAVSTCFPALIDAWGLLPDGIVVTFANEHFPVGAVVAKGRSSGEHYLPMWWYARCQAAPGVHMVDVNILEGGPAAQIGGCPASSNQTRVRFRVEVLEERSPNCDMRSNGGVAGGGTGSGTGGGAGGGGSGSGSGNGSGGGGGRRANPFVGRWTTDFGPLVLTDAGNGTVRGTLGTSGAVVIGKVKDGELIGTFSDGNGDGRIDLVSPDGTTLSGEWKRDRGPDAGRSGQIGGTFVPGSDSGTGGTGPGGDLPGGDLPGGGGGNGGGATPGGPGTSSLPPLRPTPAALSGLTLQAPELRVTPGQEVPVSLWLLNAADVVNMNWELVFDPNVASASTATGAVTKGNLLTEAFEANPAEAGRVRMGFAQKKGITGTGTVSVHRLKAVGAVGTRTPLTLRVTTITDSRPKALSVALLHGFVEIVAPGTTTPGSTGGGAGPTMQDAYNALRMSVGLLPENLAVDMDRDGKVTSLDAYLIMTTVFLNMKGGK